jgi:hypothetical protein
MQSVTNGIRRRCGSLRAADSSQGRASRFVFVDALQQFARSILMFDVVMMAIAFVFFALSIAYVYACDQL